MPSHCTICYDYNITTKGRFKVKYYEHSYYNSFFEIVKLIQNLWQWLLNWTLFWFVNMPCHKVQYIYFHFFFFLFGKSILTDNTAIHVKSKEKYLSSHKNLRTNYLYEEKYSTVNPPGEYTTLLCILLSTDRFPLSVWGLVRINLAQWPIKPDEARSRPHPRHCYCAFLCSYCAKHTMSRGGNGAIFSSTREGKGREGKELLFLRVKFGLVTLLLKFKAGYQYTVI